MDSETTSLVNRSYVGTSVLAAAFILSIPLYVVVAWILVGQSGTPFIRPAELAPFMTRILLAGGLFELASAEVVQRVMFRSVTKRDTAESQLIGYRSTVVIANALREAAAITGLVATLLTAEMTWCVGFGAAAAATILIAWPRRSAIQRLAEDPETRPIE